jgi:hypothetical protein
MAVPDETRRRGGSGMDSDEIAGKCLVCRDVCAGSGKWR